MDSYKTVDRKTMYQGAIVNVHVDDIVLPNGKVGKREIVLHHNEGVGILPVDGDDVYLVRQYRHPLGAHVLEIPAGIMEKGEIPEDSAARELEEEIGFKPGKLTFVAAANNAIGVSNDKIHIYIAENLTQTAQNLDPDEFLTIEKHSLAACKKMIETGEIYDSKTILALYAYFLQQPEGQ